VIDDARLVERDKAAHGLPSDSPISGSLKKIITAKVAEERRRAAIDAERRRAHEPASDVPFD